MLGVPSLLLLLTLAPFSLSSFLPSFLPFLMAEMTAFSPVFV
jgi:hypothetical protein